jgi:hypothetical protein
MSRIPLTILLLLLAGCGQETPEANQPVDLPLPSGPPVAQQADSVPSSAPEQSGPGWETAASGEGTALRLTEPGGRLLLSLACLGSPPRLVVSAPGFSPIGSEDRFSLGLGDDPVTLVADPTRQAKGGVTAEGAAPSDFGERLQRADQLIALYGTQQVGPVAAPSDALKEVLARACIPLQ